ncbi:MAG: DUF1013 domain-containing protein [Parvibaculales bacterium]
MNYPLMPKATAVWLIDNTALTFDQIAEFCGLHPLEVKGIADGDVAHGIRGMDPINNGQLTRDEIERCQNDPTARLELLKSQRDLPEVKKSKGSKYMPLSKRQERPDAIYWLIRNHPELNDAQVGRLVRTTKPTIQSIRERTHWNISNLKPVDPVTLGLCKQVDLDHEVARAARRVERAAKKNAKLADDKQLLSAEESVAPVEETQAEIASGFGGLAAPEVETKDVPDVDSVFSNFKDD